MNQPEPPPLPWEPFAREGRWWESDLWRYNLALAGREDERIQAAEEQLRAVFPASWVAEQLADVEDYSQHEHPFFGEFTMAPSLGLLELGYALAVLDPGPSVIKRLRHPEQYNGVELELFVGTLVAATGADAHMPDARRGSQPDWIATWSDGSRLAFEAKVPARNATSRRRQQIVSGIGRLAYEEDLHDLRLPIHFQPNPARVDALAGKGAGGQIDVTAAMSYSLDLVRAARAAADAGRTGEVDLGDLGAIQIGEYAPPGTGVRLTVEGHLGDPEFLARRTAGFVYEAAGQIAAAGVPGILVLDGSWHFPFTGWEAGIREALATRDCSGVAAVLVHFSFARGLWPNHAFYAISGQALGAITDQLDDVFEICDHDHLHFEPLRPPGPHDCLF